MWTRSCSVIRFGLCGALPPKLSRCDSLQLSPAAFGCVPRGQRELLDADTIALMGLVIMSGGACSCCFACSCSPHRVRPAPRLVAAREDPHREALWKVLCSRDARSGSLTVVVVLAAASRTPLLRGLITTRCIPAAAHQVVISCDMCFLSQRCGSDVILASSSHLAGFWSD